MGIRRRADHPTASAVSFTGRCQLAIIELRMKYFVGRALCAQLSRRRAVPRSRMASDGADNAFTAVTRFPGTEAGP